MIRGTDGFGSNVATTGVTFVMIVIVNRDLSREGTVLSTYGCDVTCLYYGFIDF